MEPMNIAFCVNNSYIPYITVAIKSIAEIHRHCNVRIHILTDNISASNHRRLAETVEGYDRITTEIYIVDATSLNGVKTGVWTLYAWYRILLPELLPSDIERVLYLDADTLVVDDLSELFLTDMTNIAIAAALDPMSSNNSAFERCGYESDKKYICSGILLINLEYWRKHNLTAEIIKWANINRERITFPDQDAINYVCRDIKKVLPLRFNIVKLYLTDMYMRRCYVEEIKDGAYNPAIIHYAGCYPWIKFFATHPMQDYWDKYNNMLKEPVKQVYIPRKWLFFKVLIWRLLHPFKKQTHLTIEDIKRRLLEYDS